MLFQCCCEARPFDSEDEPKLVHAVFPSSFPVVRNMVPRDDRETMSAIEVRSRAERGIILWVVDTSRELDHKVLLNFNGVCWHGSTTADDRVIASDGSRKAANGALLHGKKIIVKDGTEWIALESGLYLPLRVEGSQVLFPLQDEELM
mmetsp:Transcript_8303/g.19548  ORF Transcript_8303/g.19548 Transcript_8303/m.19548 type:complete len:148 (-) Transcript_8303:62-505(-)